MKERYMGLRSFFLTFLARVGIRSSMHKYSLNNEDIYEHMHDG